MNEDAKNASAIIGSAILAVAVTAGLLMANAGPEPEEVVEQITVEVIKAPPPAPAPVVAEPEVVEVVEVVEPQPIEGNPRIYGTVVTRRGGSYTGFIRWDRNEGSWADHLDANKLRRRASTVQSAIRFGHVRSIEVLDRRTALFHLKGGSDVVMGARATDLGSGLRALIIEDRGRETKLKWRDLESVDFRPAPEDARPAEGRIYGTLTTRSGMQFTGYVTWDVDEIYTTDVLDGEADGRDYEIPFGEIQAIERQSARSARVTLRDGESMVLRGTNDVDASNSGISVSDPGLGQIKLDWDEFDNVRFHAPDFEPGYGFFDGGQVIRGIVVTEDGAEYAGEIAWDNDEASSWEMLNGELDDVDFQVEFSQIRRIEKTRRGALVELVDGRSYELDGSNDVESGNRGITVSVDGDSVEIEWDDFRELRIER